MAEINDLRSAPEFLKSQPGQLVETDVEADPNAEISGIYRHVGSGGTVMRPTKEDGPAMLFHNVKGFPDSKVAIGILSSRKRVGLLLDTDYKTPGWKLPIMESCIGPAMSMYLWPAYLPRHLSSTLWSEPCRDAL